jgi:hypothetical protein
VLCYARKSIALFIVSNKLMIGQIISTCSRFCD